VTLVSKTFQRTDNFIKKFWGVQYSNKKISWLIIQVITIRLKAFVEELCVLRLFFAQKWKQCLAISELKFPNKNEFIPSNLETKPLADAPSVIPKIIDESPLSR